VNIAAQGSGEDLDFYWAINGSGAFHIDLVAGADSTASAPWVTATGDVVDISATTPSWDGNSVLAYWADEGSDSWTTGTVSGSSTGYSATSIAQGGSGASVTIAAFGLQDNLAVFAPISGTGDWQLDRVAGTNTTFSAPAINADGDDINVAAVGPDGELLFYYAASGSDTWHAETIAGPGSVT